ncbi:MAG: hypothetical protein ACI4SB_00415, partial [Acutalibacteraceae bacterium]
VDTTNRTLETNSSHEVTFEQVEGTADHYYIKNNGKYLYIESNGNLSYTDTAEEVIVTLANNGTSICISNDAGTVFLDYYSDKNTLSDRIFSAWSSSASAAAGKSNETFELYIPKSSGGVSNPEKQALYNALTEAVTYVPGTYDVDSYDALLDAVRSGLDVYNNSESTTDELTAAAQAINDAIAGLTTSIKKFPARLIKYGYAPDSTTPYNGGGTDYNNQAFAAMADAIRASDDLMNQIKTIIDYDGASTTWGDGYADTALNNAVTAYAKLYSLAFAGATTASSGTNLDASVMAQTAWNYWDK